MSTLFIILILTSILILGFLSLFRRFNRIVDEIDFATEYRNKFIEFVEHYFENYDRFARRGEIKNDLYVWLTKNVNKIQEQIGQVGTMHYLAPFRQYQISNYQIIINSIPKFRDGNIKDFDVNSVDDCLLRYLGQMENYENKLRKEVRNPFIWFKQGFREVLSYPFQILKFFDILSNGFIYKMKENIFYKLITGVIALITLLSCIVTIIVGWDQSIQWIEKILNKH